MYGFGARLQPNKTRAAHSNTVRRRSRPTGIDFPGRVHDGEFSNSISPIPSDGHCPFPVGQPPMLTRTDLNACPSAIRLTSRGESCALFRLPALCLRTRQIRAQVTFLST